MKKKVIYLSCLAVLITTIVALAQPDSSAVAVSPSTLADQVTIRRDTYGVPHILAKTEEAAAFGMGYAQAEDHCVELATRLISARGEEAKSLGTGVENDFRMKRYGNYEHARQHFDRPSPLFQRMLHAYAAGVNRYVEQHRKELPAWIPAFDGVDVFAYGLSGGIRSAFSEVMIRALQNKYPAERKAGEIKSPIKPSEVAADLMDQDTDLAGSNAWALAGSRTTSGKAMLLGNPHLEWTALYWEAQVTVPGKIDFFGSTLIGYPVLRAGFNQRLGFVTTNNAPDLEDIFALTLDADRPDHYLFEGESRPLIKREVTVEVKAADGTLKTERRTYWDSHLGPVIHRTADKAFAVKSTMLDAYRYYEGFYVLSKSKNLREFLAGMRLNYVPTSNFTYADAEGNILYVWNGRVPKRIDDGTDYRLDVPGETGKYVWQGLHQFDDLPRLLNPSGGYTQNCNNPPWYASLRNPLDPKQYPSYFESGPLALRPQMALEMLESQAKFSLADVKRLKFNDRMLLADRVKPDLIRAVKQVEHPTEELQRGLAVIEAWDNRVAAESKGGVLFQRFWDTYRAAAKQPFAVAWDPQHPAKTPAGLSDAALAVKHFEEAVRWTRQSYGSEGVAWGEVHRLRLGELDLPGDGAGGLYGLFRVVNYVPLPDGQRVIGIRERGQPMVGGGDGWVLAVEFSKPVAAYSLLAYGETTNLASKHSSDQAQMFARHEFKPVWFSESEVKAHLERAYHPSASQYRER